MSLGGEVNRLIDIDEEMNVIMCLVAAVLAHEDTIVGVSELFGELDSLLTLALAAEKYSWAPPSDDII